MRVLLDHNLPHKLRTNLGTSSDHQMVTASFMQWGHLKNGQLMSAAEGADIDIFVTGDRTPIHEQNLSNRRLAIVALSANNWPIIKNHVPQILAAIDNAFPGSFQSVDCGMFTRKKSVDK